MSDMQDAHLSIGWYDDKTGRWDKAEPRISCMHPKCWRDAVEVVPAAAIPNKLGQTHDCCGRHKEWRTWIGAEDD